MRTTTISPNVTQYAWLLRIYALVYIGLAGTLWILPNSFFIFSNVGAKVFSKYSEIPFPAEGFWVVFAISFFAGHGAQALYASFLYRLKSYFFLLIIPKIIFASTMVFFLINSTPYFAYLLGIVFECLTALFLVFFFIRSLFGKSPTVTPQVAQTTEFETPSPSNETQ